MSQFPTEGELPSDMRRRLREQLLGADAEQLPPLPEPGGLDEQPPEEAAAPTQAPAEPRRIPVSAPAAAGALGAGQETQQSLSEMTALLEEIKSLLIALPDQIAQVFGVDA